MILGLSVPDLLFIKVGIGAIFLVALGFFFVFYKIHLDEKEYEERSKKLEIEMAARRVEWQRKKEESIRELKERHEKMNEWKTRRD